jgi:hypothetical protein
MSASPFPVVDWSISINEMAAIFAAAAYHKAEGGFDVPRGLNPMTQLHSQEMVLPPNPGDPATSE